MRPLQDASEDVEGHMSINIIHIASPERLPKKLHSPMNRSNIWNQIHLSQEVSKFLMPHVKGENGQKEEMLKMNHSIGFVVSRL